MFNLLESILCSCCSAFKEWLNDETTLVGMRDEHTHACGEQQHQHTCLSVPEKKLVSLLFFHPVVFPLRAARSSDQPHPSSKVTRGQVKVLSSSLGLPFLPCEHKDDMQTPHIKAKEIPHLQVPCRQESTHETGLSHEWIQCLFQCFAS